MSCPTRSLSLALVAAVAVLAATVTPAAGQTAPPPPPVDGTADVESQTVGREDPTTPRAVLVAAEAELARIVDVQGDAAARLALGSVRDARDALKAELDGLRPTNLAATAAHIGSAQEALESTRTRGRLRPELEAVAQRLDAAARRLAVDIVDIAAQAGVDRRTVAAARARIARGDGLTRAGQHSAAAGAYGGGLGLASNSIVFDVRLFEQNIRDTLDDQTVGYSFAIVRNGDVFSAKGIGVSRTAADQPFGSDPRPHDPTDQMNIASVTKTITSAAVMKLIQQHILDLDETVAPFLPTEWDLPFSIQQLTFRDLMTQKSGLGGPAVIAGTSFATLRTAIEQGIDPDDKTFSYENANLALFRVIIPALVGVDIYGDEDLAIQLGEEAAAAQVAASTYVDYLQDEVFDTFPLPDCKPSDELQFGPAPLAYVFPDDGTPGRDPGDWTLSCGGGGLHISTLELARFFARLRYTDEILNPFRRKQMTDGFVGYQDPANGYSWNDGAFGNYHSHGGLLTYSPGNEGIGSCAISFPITIQASLVISSVGGNYPHRCAVLATAFEDAWVPQ